MPVLWIPSEPDMQERVPALTAPHSTQGDRIIDGGKCHHEVDRMRDWKGGGHFTSMLRGGLSEEVFELGVGSIARVSVSASGREKSRPWT